MTLIFEKICTIINSKYSNSAVPCLLMLFSTQSSIFVLVIYPDLFPGAFSPHPGEIRSSPTGISSFLGLRSSCHWFLSFLFLAFLSYFSGKHYSVFFSEKRAHERQNIWGFQYLRRSFILSSHLVNTLAEDGHDIYTLLYIK